jgi:glycosyltransferase involved in cell wall biosynthesis
MEKDINNEPLVSVIIPAFNASNFLKDSIESVLNQSYENIELIVINDGSKDDTEKIALSYGSKIKYFFQTNAGVSLALNNGINQSKGEYIAWLSHDDCFMPDKIKKQIDCLRLNPDSQICYTNYNVINDLGEHQGVINVPYYEKDIFSIHLLQAMFVCGSTVLIKRNCFFDKNIFFDESLRYAQDADLWMKLSFNYKFIHINEYLVNWRFHANQGSRNELQMKLDKIAYLKNSLIKIDPQLYFQRNLKLKNFKAVAFVKLGVIILKCHREPALAFSLFRSSMLNWKSIKNKAYYYYFLLLFGQFYYYFGLFFSKHYRNISRKNITSPKVDFIKATKTVNVNLS